MGIVLPLVAGAVGTLGSILGFKGAREANRTNIRLAHESMEHDREMWNLQNEYNKPENQMSRLQEAGLNPNLIYGSGNVSGLSTSTRPSSPIATVSNELANLHLPDVLGVLSSYQDWQQKQAQTSLTETQEKLVQQNILNAGIQHDVLNYKTYLQAFDLSMKQLLSDNQISISDEQVKQMREKTKQMLFNSGSILPEVSKRYALENQAKSLENEMQSNLKQYNMGLGDELWARLLAKLMDKFK